MLLWHPAKLPRVILLFIRGPSSPPIFFYTGIEVANFDSWISSDCYDVNATVIIWPGSGCIATAPVFCYTTVVLLYQGMALYAHVVTFVDVGVFTIGFSNN